jgi:Na+/H+ antiporter NhaD/arsenite permease-like protein
MNCVKRVLSFCIEEWLLTISLLGILFSSLYLGHAPTIDPHQLIPIFLLFALFVAVRGLEQSGILDAISRLLERSSFLAAKLVLLSFVLSLFLSIDVTLVTLLPAVLAMRIKERDTLVLLVAFTAHTGAALTPFGTPQNLFIFSFYQLEVLPFIQAIAPFSLTLTALFLLVSFFVPVTLKEEAYRRDDRTLSPLHGVLALSVLLLVVLSVLRVLPWYAAVLVLPYALIARQKLLRIDYPLLLTFVLFLLLANNLKTILSQLLEHPAHIFLLSSLMSQAISNVPTTLLLHQFTSQWEALLWGTNVGGFGTPVAALANLIAYRLYASRETSRESRVFLLKMVLWGFAVYFVGVLLYFSLYRLGLTGSLT